MNEYSERIYTSLIAERSYQERQKHQKLEQKYYEVSELKKKINSAGKVFSQAVFKLNHFTQQAEKNLADDSQDEIAVVVDALFQPNPQAENLKQADYNPVEVAASFVETCDLIFEALKEEHNLFELIMGDEDLIQYLELSTTERKSDFTIKYYLERNRILSYFLDELKNLVEARSSYPEIVSEFELILSDSLTKKIIELEREKKVNHSRVFELQKASREPRKTRHEVAVASLEAKLKICYELADQVINEWIDKPPFKSEVMQFKAEQIAEYQNVPYGLLRLVVEDSKGEVKDRYFIVMGNEFPNFIIGTNGEIYFFQFPQSLNPLQAVASLYGGAAAVPEKIDPQAYFSSTLEARMWLVGSPETEAFKEGIPYKAPWTNNGVWQQYNFGFAYDQNPKIVHSWGHLFDTYRPTEIRVTAILYEFDLVYEHIQNVDRYYKGELFASMSVHSTDELCSYFEKFIIEIKKNYQLE